MKKIFNSLALSYLFLAVGISNEINSFEIKNKNIKTNIESVSLISNALDAKEIKTVTASGFGTSPESAAQNAAENALTQVVGSFIDAETQIKKQKEIREGVISKTKIIKKDVRDYSQGSIKYFEILNIQQNGSIYNVTARVDVRIEDFRAYIKKLSSTKAKVSKGLFADAIVSEENLENKIKLIEKKFLEISRGQVLDVEIGQIKLLKNFYPADKEICSDYFKKKNSGWNPDHPCDNQMLNRYYPAKLNNTVVIPVNLKLRENFYLNLENTLDNIANKKVIYSNRKPHHFDLAKKYEECRNSDESSFVSPVFMVNLGNNYSGTIYCLGEIKEKLKGTWNDKTNSLCILACRDAFMKDYAYRYSGANLWHRLKISFLNTENEIFRENFIDINDRYSSRGVKVFKSLFPYQPNYTLLGRSSESFITTIDIPKNKMLLITKTLEINELKDLSNIIVELSPP